MYRNSLTNKLLIMFTYVILKASYCTLQKCDLHKKLAGFRSEEMMSKHKNENTHCPTNTPDSRHETDLHCFFELDTVSDFDFASEKCQNYVAHVAEPSTPDIHQKICSQMKHKKSYWVFLMYNHTRTSGQESFKFLTNETDATDYLINENLWADAHPRAVNESRTDFCVIGEYNTTEKKCVLKTKSCNLEHNTLCQSNKVNCETFVDSTAAKSFFHEGFCYALFTEPKTWFEAEAHCTSVDGFLAEIYSEADAKLFNDFVGENETHIGLYSAKRREPIYTYSLAKLAKKLNWSKPQPFATNTYGALKDSSFAANNGDKKLPFLCQISRSDPCSHIGKNYAYVLGDCYAIVGEREMPIAECYSKCEQEGAVAPLASTSREREALVYLSRYLRTTYTTINIPVIYENGKYWYYKDEMKGDPKYKDFKDFDWPGINKDMSGQKSVKRVLYISWVPWLSTKISGFWRYDNNKAYCACKVDCPPDPEHCHANNINEETNSCNECQKGYFGSLCQLKCGTDVCNETGLENTDCEEGSYENNCNEICSPNCKNMSTCNIVTGTCLECKKGFTGELCDDLRSGICKRDSDKITRIVLSIVCFILLSFNHP